MCPCSATNIADENKQWYTCINDNQVTHHEEGFMLYNVDFATAGLVILIILYALIKKRYDQKMTTIIELRKIIFFLILADSFDLITAATISYPYAVSLWVNYLLNILFFETEVICLSLFPRYIHAIVNNPKKNIFDYINKGLLYVVAIICASTPITHSIFYFNESRKYTHGYLYLLIFIAPLYFLIFSFIYMHLNRKSFNNRQYYTIVGFILSAIAGPVLQSLLPGNRIIDFFALSVAAFLAVIGLETPDFLKLDQALKELEKHKNMLEVARKNEEERNKVIHEMTKSASWSIHMDADHNVTQAFWSDEFFWMLGYEKDDIIDQSALWSNSLHPDDADASSEAFLKGLQGVEPYDIIYRLRNKKGEYRWYRGTGELKVDKVTNTSAYHGIIQDIHDEKIKEELTKEKLIALEELEKSQSALKEALHRAEAADRAKSDFLANMSHEIRTPINAVLGMNEMIARESTEEKIQEYSATVADAGNALLSLINDILDFSKIEAGKMELAPANYELAVLLREVNNIMNIRFKDKGLDFIIQNNPNIPNQLYGDEIRIRQILINILNNALKYTDKGSVTFEINYENQENNTALLLFKISDTGVGIKKEYLDDLFKSFTRIDLEHNRKKEGTGLGLNITKSLVDLMGGTIDITSTYGSGSVFTVRIPQKIVNDSPIGIFDKSQTHTVKTKTEAQFTAKTAKILIVDDVPTNLRVIKALLRRTGIAIDLANSGQECLDAMARSNYDLVLLDHMMPDLDGIETMNRLKEDSTHPNQDTPVIMLTANAIAGAKEEYLSLGFTDYLSKPVRPDELETMLVKYLPAEKIVYTSN